MKQLLCHLQSGETMLAELPAPTVEPGHLLIQTRRTLVSQGTEKMLVQFGKASLLQKARSQPDKVREVLRKIRTEGLMPTMEAVFRRLDEPLPLGYCNAGVVIGVGEGVTGFAIGDRVASNGPHAEIVSVPANLCARVPDNVGDDEAAFTVAAAIALQGVRLTNPTFGETAVVIGLGLLGQLAVQFLRASGCRVLGFDFDPAKVGLARRFGAEAHLVGPEVDPVATVLTATASVGADLVVITASASGNEVITQSARMSRKRGRIVLVGVVGLELRRADFYEKELTFQVSCSYGPGRYDFQYEEKGVDYPLPFVRWTESRNFAAVLAAMAAGSLQVGPLVTRRVPLERCHEIYGQLDQGGLASLLMFSESPAARSTILVAASRPAPGAAHLAVVGTGNFTKMTVLPALEAAGAPLKYLASASGVSSTHLARKYRVPFSTTNLDQVLADDEVRGLLVCTRHDLHAPQTIRALAVGKHVLVEKPLCLTRADLESIAAARERSTGTVTVGFNRRFSPHVRKIRELLGDSPGPLTLVATMNAGTVPLNHWVHDPAVGGGRLLGEACHLVDLAVHLTRSLVTAVAAGGLGGGGAPAGDSATVVLRHANGSLSTVNYFSTGHRSYGKERIEVFAQERVIVLDDFRETRGYGFKSFRRLATRPDKGHAAQFAEFARRVREGGLPLVDWSEIENVARATLAIPAALRGSGWVQV